VERGQARQMGQAAVRAVRAVRARGRTPLQTQRGTNPLCCRSLAAGSRSDGSARPAVAVAPTQIWIWSGMFLLLSCRRLAGSRSDGSARGVAAATLPPTQVWRGMALLLCCLRMAGSRSDGLARGVAATLPPTQVWRGTALLLIRSGGTARLLMVVVEAAAPILAHTGCDGSARLAVAVTQTQIRSGVALTLRCRRMAGSPRHVASAKLAAATQMP
jgi:hypothetical protein